VELAEPQQLGGGQRPAHVEALGHLTAECAQARSTVIWPTNAPSDTATRQHTSGSASAARRWFSSASNLGGVQPGGANEG